MKCECEECSGTGTVECDECDGKGTIEMPLWYWPIPKDHPQFDELSKLKADAQRAVLQYEELKRMRPDKVDSFNQQLTMTLNEINRLAEKLVAKK